MAEPFQEEIDEFARQDREKLPPVGAVLFLGSSTIRLWSSIETAFPHATVINRGFGGSQIEHSIRYANRIIIPYRPRLIMYYAGDNDLATGKRPKQVFADYRHLTETVFTPLPRTRMVFISIKPSPFRADLLPDIREANSLIRNFSRLDDRLAYADVFHPMLAEDGTPRPELFGEDALHMNVAGYEIWNRTLLPYVEENNSNQ